MRKRLEVGDVFEVKVDASAVKYFQYIADDSEQLDSYVIRAFDKTYSSEGPIDCSRIVQGEVQFYAHVFLKVGIKLGTWRKVGHAPPPETVDVFFRCSRDYGNPDIKISKRWYVWQVNHPEKDVGELPPQFESAEIGVVVSPGSIEYRMIHGEYDFFYPSF
jgi:hypothetical protein